jgi:type II secretory pathway predicted ATPase ExeA
MDSINIMGSVSTSKPNHESLVRESAASKQRRQIDEAVAQLEQMRLEKFSSVDLNTISVRQKLAAFHPMLEQRYFNETDETNAFYDIVYDHVIARKSGLYVTGEFRVGKTSTIENSIVRLRDDLPWLAVLYHSAKRQLGQSKKSLCEDMLRSFRYPSSTYQNAADLLARFMMTETVQAGSKTCLLFIDEAQMFTVMHMRYLLEIWNELRQEGFILVTVLVGQDGLISLKQLTSEQDHGAVVARFFVKRYSLGGLHSLKDMKEYLAKYDTALVFPYASPWPYSRFFCRKAFDAGWRLENEAELLWSALMMRSKAEEKMLKYAGFRLAFVNDSIHAFLVDSMQSDKISFKGSIKLWGEAVSAAAENELFIGHGNIRT